jgi:hypothetical protein
VAYSYLWATREHPDPKGHQLRALVRFLRFLGATHEYKGHRILVFWDWLSLHQDYPEGSRTPYATTLFQRGLRKAYFWYTHPSVVTLINPQLPAGGLRAGWSESAWPYFEACLSRILKEPSKVVDLQQALAWLGDASLSSEAKRSYYRMVEACGGLRGRGGLPVTPKAFRGAVEAMHLSVELDRPLLQRQYEETFAAAMRHARVLQLGGLKGATSEDWTSFVDAALPLCKSLETLYLKDNDALTADIATIVEKCRNSESTLTNLNIGNTACFGDGVLALTGRYQRLTMLNLEGSEVSGAKRALQKVLPPGCWVRVDDWRL